MFSDDRKITLDEKTLKKLYKPQRFISIQFKPSFQLIVGGKNKPNLPKPEDHFILPKQIIHNRFLRVRCGGGVWQYKLRKINLVISKFNTWRIQIRIFSLMIVWNRIEKKSWRK